MFSLPVLTFATPPKVLFTGTTVVTALVEAVKSQTSKFKPAKLT